LGFCRFYSKSTRREARRQGNKTAGWQGSRTADQGGKENLQGFDFSIAAICFFNSQGFGKKIGKIFTL
jgi:hypothetical protein